MSTVFLSYCQEDFAVASRLRDALIAHGMDLWWHKNLFPGQEWKQEIREAMKQSSVVILCLSAQALERTRLSVRGASPIAPGRPATPLDQ
jgi:hypothetical protein